MISWFSSLRRDGAVVKESNRIAVIHHHAPPYSAKIGLIFAYITGTCKQTNPVYTFSTLFQFLEWEKSATAIVSLSAWPQTWHSTCAGIESIRSRKREGKEVIYD